MAGTSGRSGDGAMRGLVGAGPSKVGVSGSMRARDVSRPRPEDVTRARKDVVIRRRAQSTPPKPTPPQAKPTEVDYPTEVATLEIADPDEPDEPQETN